MVFALATGSLVLALLADAAQRPALHPSTLRRVRIAIVEDGDGVLYARMSLVGHSGLIAAVKANPVGVGLLDYQCYELVRQIAEQAGVPMPDMVYATHSEARPEWRGKGLGRLLYQAMGSYVFEERGTFIVSGSCDVGGQTFVTADRVWKSLARDHLVLRGEIVEEIEYRPQTAAIQMTEPLWSHPAVQKASLAPLIPLPPPQPTLPTSLEELARREAVLEAELAELREDLVEAMEERDQIAQDFLMERISAIHMEMARHAAHRRTWRERSRYGRARNVSR